MQRSWRPHGAGMHYMQYFFNVRCGTDRATTIPIPILRSSSPVREQVVLQFTFQSHGQSETTASFPVSDIAPNQTRELPIPSNMPLSLSAPARAKQGKWAGERNEQPLQGLGGLAPLHPDGVPLGRSSSVETQVRQPSIACAMILHCIGRLDGDW